MKKVFVFLLVLFTTNLIFSQIKVVNIEKVNLPEKVYPYQAKFSPDGKYLYFSNNSYSGIWRYNIAEKTTQEITNDNFSGFGFDINQAGDKIAYRRTINNGTLNRRQEIVEKNLVDNSTTILQLAQNLSTPIYYNEKIINSKNADDISNIKTDNEAKVLGDEAKVLADEVKILGIENTKIAIIKNGKKEILDPLGKGSYIWPSLSPDGKTIVAVDMTQGAFLCTIDGKVTQILGRGNAPSFTHDGKWIVYMLDKDDGHRIISSDIYAVSVDGQTTIQLTNDANINLNPVCSVNENKVVFSTSDGNLFILNYEDIK
jgi:Tol biopolymer transport system component